MHHIHPSLRGFGGGAPATTLRYLGHSSFLLTSAGGTRVLMDPIPAGYGYEGPPLEGVDAVTISHEHRDHANAGLASGSPIIIRGLSDGDWAAVDHRIKDVAIRSVNTYHDGQQGSQRGKNAVFIFDVDGMRVVHLGDLGHPLSREQVSAIKPVDVLLLPVGGSFTLEPAEANRVAQDLEARIVVPMHYKTGKLRPDWPGVGVDEFLAGEEAETLEASVYTFTRDTLPQEKLILVLKSE